MSCQSQSNESIENVSSPSLEQLFVIRDLYENLVELLLLVLLSPSIVLI